jgi:hypothetical protein
MKWVVFCWKDKHNKQSVYVRGTFTGSPFLKGNDIMKQPTMVYRSPATKPHNTCVDRKTGKTYEHKVVDGASEADEQSEVDQALESGWFGSPAEAIAASEIPVLTETVNTSIPSDDAPPTRAELEEKANELGVVFDSKMKDKTLLKKIKQAIETREQPIGEFL